MVSSIATSPAIDLSRIPAPQIIDQPDYETRRAAMIAQLVSVMPSFSALVESDPAIKLIETDAFEDMILVQQVVDAIRNNLIAYAAGAHLENLGALYGVLRLEITPANPATGAAAVFESDEELRGRILLAPHSFSVAGPELAYVYHAKSASSDVLDASATSPSPGEVIVSVLSRTGNGTAPAPTLAAVDAVVNNGLVRPLTDFVTVQSADVQVFAINAALWLYAGPDANLILTTAQASLAAYLNSARRLKRDIPRSAIIAALHVAGVQRVVLTDPAADIICTPLQAGWADPINVTVAGIAE